MVVLAIAILAVNDGWLKHSIPSFITGKASDFAGLFFAPILAIAIVEVAAATAGYRLVAERIRVTVHIAIGAVFSVAQLTSWGARLYLFGFQLMSFSPGWGSKISLTQDPTDLVATSSLAASYLWSQSRIQLNRGGSSGQQISCEEQR